MVKNILGKMYAKCCSAVTELKRFPWNMQVEISYNKLPFHFSVLSIMYEFIMK